MLVVTGAVADEDLPEIRVGVLSIRSAQQTLQTWQPTAEYLTQTISGFRFSVVPLDSAEFSEALSQGRIDFVLTNPGHYVVLEARHRISRIATLVNGWNGIPLKAFGGVIAVRAERRDLRALEDLRGKRVAAVGPDWLGAYQSQAGELLAAGIDVHTEMEVFFTGEPQDRAVGELMERRADAAFIRTGVLEELAKEGRLDLSRVRVLAARQIHDFPLLLSTRLYAEWPFAAMPQVPGVLASKVAVALMNMGAESPAAIAGSYQGWTIPSDYQPVHQLMRDLHLPPYDAKPQFSVRDVVVRYNQSLLIGLGLSLFIALLALGRFRRLHYTVTSQMDLISERTRALETEVTARRSAEEGLQLAASVFEHSNDGIIITDSRNIIIDVNKAFETITGYSREDVLGRNPSILRSGRQDTAFYQDLWRMLEETGHWRGEIWNRRKTGEVFVELLDITAVRERDGEVAHYVAIFSDITDLRDSQERLKLMAHYDPLTRLPNRTLLADRLNQGVALVDRDETLLAVCFLDLDGFKPINDQFGHEVGDRLLVEVSRRMMAEVRAVDTVARLGGDEFVLLLTGLADANELEVILSRLMASVAQAVLIDGDEHRVTASIGVTLYPLDDADPESLMRHADQAMYLAKRDGRNRFNLFDANQDKEALSRVHHNERIRTALNLNEFELHYQPKVDMRAGRVIGLEALIRWQHPQRGLIHPGEFLPAVEQSDLIAEIDEWVIGETLRQMGAWQEAGLVIPVSVNVSARKLQSADFVDRVGAVLARHDKVAPELLEFEILESAALSDIEGVRGAIRACRALGTRFSLDDFGTGYSSLSYLKRLPVDTIKIDQSFVRDLLENPDDLAIVEGIVGLAKVFDRHVVGEGVESPEHGVMLMRLGCDLAQGYGIARPLAADRVAAWCKDFQPDPHWLAWAGVAWNIDDFPLLVAQSDHVKWVRNIVRLAEGGSAGMSQEEIGDFHRCRFGRWYYGKGHGRYGGRPEFAAVESIHREVHRVGSGIAQQVAAGSHAEAERSLPRLLELRDEVLRHLEDIQKMAAAGWH